MLVAEVRRGGVEPDISELAPISHCDVRAEQVKINAIPVLVAKAAA